MAGCRTPAIPTPNRQPHPQTFPPRIHGDPVKAGFLRKLRARGIKPLAEADLAAPGEGGTATQHNTQALAAALAWWEAASQPA